MGRGGGVMRRWEATNARIDGGTRWGDQWRRFHLVIYDDPETRYFEANVKEHGDCERCYPWVEFTELYADGERKISYPEWKISISADHVTSYGLPAVVEAFQELLYPPRPPLEYPEVWELMAGVA